MVAKRGIYRYRNDIRVEVVKRDRLEVIDRIAGTLKCWIGDHRTRHGQDCVAIGTRTRNECLADDSAATRAVDDRNLSSVQQLVGSFHNDSRGNITGATWFEGHDESNVAFRKVGAIGERHAQQQNHSC